LKKLEDFPKPPPPEDRRLFYCLLSYDEGRALLADMTDHFADTGSSVLTESHRERLTALLARFQRDLEEDLGLEPGKPIERLNTNR
jgi:hypothetical protein